MAREFPPKKNRPLLKDLRNVGESGEEVPKVVAPMAAGTRRRGGGSRCMSCWMVVSMSVRGIISGASHSSQLNGRFGSSMRCLRYLLTRERRVPQS